MANIVFLPPNYSDSVTVVTFLMQLDNHFYYFNKEEEDREEEEVTVWN